MPLRHSCRIVAPQLANCCATVIGLWRHSLYIGDIDVMGYFYDRVVAECTERSAYEERFACPGDVSNGKIDGEKLSQWRLHICIYCIYKIGFSENKISPLPSQAAATIFLSKS